MKKSLFQILILSILMRLLSACSDEESDRNSQFPNISKITLSEMISDDTGTVNKKDSYSFTNNQLLNHSTIQEFYGQSLNYEINFSYSNHQAIWIDINGNKAIYTLDKNGYATECIYQQHDQTREYQFFYSNDYLTQIDEKIDGIPYSTIQLHYASGDLQSIKSNGQTFLFEVGKDINTYHLPCLLFRDLHPLSMHIDAIYARLLGKQSFHLITRNIPEGNNKEWTTYTYQLSADNKPTQIKAATTSTGLVYDENGVSSEVTQRDSITISVRIE